MAIQAEKLSQAPVTNRTARREKTRAFFAQSLKTKTPKNKPKTQKEPVSSSFGFPSAVLHGENHRLI
jgi:hypothetical protein